MCVCVCVCEKLATSIMMVDVCFWNRKNRIFEKNKIEKNVYQFNLYQECLKKCLSDCKWWVWSVWSNNRFQLNFFLLLYFRTNNQNESGKGGEKLQKKNKSKAKKSSFVNTSIVDGSFRNNWSEFFSFLFKHPSEWKKSLRKNRNRSVIMCQ